MLPDKVLGMDVWADYANFRRPYSTTSPLTYPFPTRTAVAGLASTILGLQRDSYYDIFSEENSKIGIQLLMPVKKKYMGFNLIDTKKGYYLWDIRDNPRTQIQYELLVNPMYRIYLWLKSDTLYYELKERLSTHRSHYTPYLGMAQMIANFRYIDEFGVVARQANQTEVSTVALEENGVTARSGHRIGKISIPAFMDSKRTPSFRNLVYDSCQEYHTEENHRLLITKGQYAELNNGINAILF